jgi:hypothetical protein
MSKTTLDAEYRYGKLYNVETGKRILIAEDAKVMVIVKEGDILEKDPYNHYIEPPKKEKIEKELEEKKKANKCFRYELIAERGSYLKFQIKAGKANKDGKYFIERTFKVKLLAELYMVQKKEGDSNGVVYPACCVVESVEGELPRFEPIYAYSLNDAYMKTYDFYFALFGKPTTNIYNNYFLIKEGKQIPLFKKRMLQPVNVTPLFDEGKNGIETKEKAVEVKQKEAPKTPPQDALKSKILTYVYLRYSHLIKDNTFFIGRAIFPVEMVVSATVDLFKANPTKDLEYLVDYNVEYFQT